MKQMNTSTIESRGAGKRLGMLLLGLAVALAGTLALSGSQAKAAEETITFDGGKVNLGFAFNNVEILPAPNNLAGTPLPNLWEAKASASTPFGEGTPPNELTSFKPAGCITQVTFSAATGSPLPNDGQEGRPLVGNPAYPCTTANQPNGTAVVDVAVDGSFTGTANDFQFPIMIVPNPLDGSPVPITLVAPEGITGAIDSETGDVRIDGPMQVQVLVGLTTNPLGEYCALDLPGREPGGLNNSTPIPDNGFALTTTYALPTAQGYAGTPYATGLEGDGALVSTWNQVDDSTSVGGADCSTVDSVSKGFGGIWLSSNVAEPADFPTCEDLGLVGTFAACEEPAPPAARMGNLTIKGPAKAKRGKVATYRVTVRNVGDATMTGVRLKVAGKGVSFNTSVGQIGAGGNRTVRVKAKFKRPGKVKATFTATASGGLKKVARKTVTVRK